MAWLPGLGVVSNPNLLPGHPSFTSPSGAPISGRSYLVGGERYEASELKLRGQEVYWTAYLHLIEDSTHGKSLDQALARIDDAFMKRNADKRIKDDSYAIEGSGLLPVKWDYRRDSLLAYITHKGM